MKIRITMDFNLQPWNDNLAPLHLKDHERISAIDFTTQLDFFFKEMNKTNNDGILSQAIFEGVTGMEVLK